MTETPTGPDDAAPAPPEGGEPIPAMPPTDARPPRRLEKTLLVLVAGLAMAAPFVHDALGPLVFVSHVPFLFLVASGRYPAVRLAAYLAGFVGMSIGVIWLWGVAPPLPFVGAAYFALYVLALGWATGKVAGALSLPLVVIYPPLLVASEYLRLRFSLFSTTWLDVAYPLHVWTDMIQISSLFGHHAVSLLVGVCQAAIVEGLLLVARRRDPGLRPTSAPRVAASLVLAGLLVAGAVLYGRAGRGGDPGDGPLVGIVQGNIPQAVIMDGSRAGEVLGTYSGITWEARDDDVDLWVWPESAYPQWLTRQPGALSHMRVSSRRLGVPLLLGSIGAIEVDGEQRPTNSAFLFSPEGEIVGRYDKRVLVPFGETLPLVAGIRSLREPIGEFLRKTVGFRPHIVPGKTPTVLETSWSGGDLRLGVLVCYEDVLPHLARQLRNEGAGILVNPSNEGWFPERELEQHIAMAKYRAVETGAPLVRATNTGISCIISARGEVLHRLEVDGRDRGVRGHLVARVPRPAVRPTLSMRLGETLPILSLLGGIVLVFLARRRGRSVPGSA